MIDPGSRLPSLASGDDVAPCFVLGLPNHMQVFAEFKPGSKTPYKEEAQGKDNRQNIERQHDALFAFLKKLGFMAVVSDAIASSQSIGGNP